MAEPRWLTDAEARAWRGYRRMHLLLDARIARDLAADSGLSAPDYDVLSYLSEVPGRSARLSELATRMLWSRSRLSHHLTRMEKRGLVAREDYAADGRGATIALTPGGLRAIEGAAPAHVESVRRHLVDLLTEEQLAALAEISTVVVDHLGEAPR